MRTRRESGFTLPELIMAVTILGVIAATIGGVLVAAFSSTTGINDRFDASRAAKQTTLYWSPDVASVETVNPTGRVCGSGDGAGSSPLITFESTTHPPLAAAPAPAADDGTPRLTTWWLDDTNPARVVRRTCENGPARADPHNPVVSRIADRDDETAGLATSAAPARAQVAAECSSDGVTFQQCATNDTAPIIRITVRAPDVAASRDPSAPNAPQFQTYQFRVAGTREVQ